MDAKKLGLASMLNDVYRKPNKPKNKIKKNINSLIDHVLIFKKYSINHISMIQKYINQISF